MRCHYRGNVRSDGGTEGRELYLLESSTLQMKYGERSVRVDGGRPVPRKMLGGRKEPFFLGPGNERRSQTTHSFRGLAIGTRVNNRIRRVHVEV